MKAWKAVFAIAALFTLGAGLPSLLMPAADTLGINYPDTPQTHLMVRFVGLLICVFGIGNAIAATNPPAHRGIAWIGAIGKAGAVVLLTHAFTSGVIPLAPFVLGVGDLIFVVLFAVFLWKTRPSGDQTDSQPSAAV